MKNLSQHSIWKLIERIAKADPRIRTISFVDPTMVDPRQLALPALIVKYGPVTKENTVITATFHIVAVDRIVPDRSNAALVPSTLTTVLLDLHNVLADPNLFLEGVTRIGPPQIETLDAEQDSTLKIQSMSFDVDFNDASCLTALGYMPIDVAGDGYVGTAPDQGSGYFDCSMLTSCEAFQAHDAALSGLMAQYNALADEVRDMPHTLIGGTNISVEGDLSSPQISTTEDTVFRSITADQVNATQSLLYGANSGAAEGWIFYEEEGAIVNNSRFYYRVGDALRVTNANIFTNRMVTGLSLSAQTIYSGGTELSRVFSGLTAGGLTGVNQIIPVGLIQTGGTATAVTISVSTTPQFDSVTVTGLTRSSTVSATTVIGSTISGDTINGAVILSGGTDLAGLFAPLLLQRNAQPVTSYTFQLSDMNKIVTLQQGGAIMAMIPNNTTIPFPMGTQLLCSQTGPGQVTLSGASGVNIRSYLGMTKTAGLYASVSLLKIATNDWLLAGNLTT